MHKVQNGPAPYKICLKDSHCSNTTTNYLWEALTMLYSQVVAKVTKEKGC